MEGIVLREYFLAGLNIVERATQRQANLPILSTVLMRAETGALYLSATNLEFAIQVTIPAKITTPGILAVPHRILNGFVVHVPEESITVKTSGKTLGVRTAHQKVKIQGFSQEDFPILPDPPIAPQAVFSGEALTKAFAQVMCAVSQSDTRPELSGVLCDISEEKATVVATDTFRLALRTIPRLSSGQEFSAIIPNRAAQEIVRLFDKENNVTIAASRTQLEVRTDTKKLLTRLIDGTFPDFSTIIPHTALATVTVERATLLSHLGAAAFFSGPLNDVRLSIDPKNNITLSASHSEVGEYETKINGKIQGAAAHAAFNHRYLFYGVNNLSSKEIIIELNNESKPGVLKDPQPQTEALYLVMPIRT